MTPTQRQREVLESIDQFASVHGYAPTMRELAEDLGLASTNAVAEALARLERAGWISRKPGAQRTLHLTPEGRHQL